MSLIQFLFYRRSVISVITGVQQRATIGGEKRLKHFVVILSQLLLTILWRVEVADHVQSSLAIQMSLAFV